MSGSQQQPAVATDRPVPLLFFAKSRELAGRAKTTHSLPTATQLTCAQLLAAICSQNNLLPIQASVILAINGEYRADLQELIDCDSVTEIAVIPPISGG